jgi:hypothetical protein
MRITMTTARQLLVQTGNTQTQRKKVTYIISTCNTTGEKVMTFPIWDYFLQRGNMPVNELKPH